MVFKIANPYPKNKSAFLQVDKELVEGAREVAEGENVGEMETLTTGIDEIEKKISDAFATRGDNPLKQEELNVGSKAYAKTDMGKAEIALNNALAANNGESNKETNILQAKYDNLRNEKLKKQE